MRNIIFTLVLCSLFPPFAKGVDEASKACVFRLLRYSENLLATDDITEIVRSGRFDEVRSKYQLVSIQIDPLARWAYFGDPTKTVLRDRVILEGVHFFLAHEVRLASVDRDFPPDTIGGIDVNHIVAAYGFYALPPNTPEDVNNLFSQFKKFARGFQQINELNNFLRPDPLLTKTMERIPGSDAMEPLGEIILRFPNHE